MRILVTGAGGYIGTVLVPMLLDEGFRVRAVDRFFFGRELLPEHPRLEVVREDCRMLRADHLDGIDAVVDLVAISNDPSGELFREATFAINHRARARAARLAKQAGARRYVLPSSCSAYGHQADGVIADERSAVNPLTTYASANLAAERDVLALAGDGFEVVVLRQATVFGLSPRMRFDLAINGMTYGAWKTGRLPLMRDGQQWRPMIHVRDVAAANMFMLAAPAAEVSGEIFNVGSANNVYQVAALGGLVAEIVSRDVTIEWYGDVDHRSYRVSFDKIERLGWRAQLGAADGVAEICEALAAGRTERTIKTITLDWYRAIEEWHRAARDLELHGGMLELPGPGPAKEPPRSVGTHRALAAALP